METVTTNKGNRYLLEPDKEAEDFFWSNFFAVKFIWNKMLGDRMSGQYCIKTEDDVAEDMLNMFEIPVLPVYLPIKPSMYKEEHPWLKEADSLALSNKQLDLKRAFDEFYGQESFSYSKKTLARCERQERKPTFYELEGHPNFKSRRDTNWHSYTTNNQNGTIAIINGTHIKLPKIGPVRIKMHRQLPKGHKIKSATISLEANGKFYVSILTEHEEEAVKPAVIDEYSEVIGLDYSMPELYVDSNNNCPEFDRWYRSSQEKLAREQRRLSKMSKDSKNYMKQKKLIARLHHKIACQRKDFLHKESLSIAKNYDLVCIEGLNMKAMAKSLNFGKAVHDNGWGMFTKFLEYKLSDRGKHLIRIEKHYPSSKLCHRCGWKHENLTLEDRIWECAGCGTVHLRDYNAAVNIKVRGLEIYFSLYHDTA